MLMSSYYSATWYLSNIVPATEPEPQQSLQQSLQLMLLSSYYSATWYQSNCHCGPPKTQGSGRYQLQVLTVLALLVQTYKY